MNSTSLSSNFPRTNADEPGGLSSTATLRPENSTVANDPAPASVVEVQLYPEAAHFYIPSLDGIRAVAFLLVFVSHAGWGNIVPGGLGVTIFFFLSGYLITTLMRREAERTGSVNLGKFYLRRFLRIFPPYYLVVAVTTGAFLATEPSRFDSQALLTQLIQFSNYFLIFGRPESIPMGMHITWSLSVEEHFYLLFPLGYLTMRTWFSPRSQAIILAIACGMILGWRFHLVYGMGEGEHRIYQATDTRIDSILYGCLLAVVGNPMLDRSRRESRSTTWMSGVLVGLGLVLMLVSLTIRDPRFRETFRYSVQGLALIPLFSAAIRYPNSVWFRGLNFGWVRFLGVLSYSLYLVHFNVLILLSKMPWSKGARAIVALGISLGLAYAIYQFVERPAAQLRKRLCQS